MVVHTWGPRITTKGVLCLCGHQVPLEEGLNKTIQYFSRELEHQANNQYIPKPKAARMKKGRPRHNWGQTSYVKRLLVGTLKDLSCRTFFLETSPWTWRYVVRSRIEQLNKGLRVRACVCVCERERNSSSGLEDKKESTRRRRCVSSWPSLHWLGGGLPLWWHEAWWTWLGHGEKNGGSGRGGTSALAIISVVNLCFWMLFFFFFLLFKRSFC